MIKIITNMMHFRTFQFKGMMNFCTKSIKKKSSQISTMFSDKAASVPNDKPITSGRAWKASELRIKSTEDLHKLWFVCVRQKNLVLADELAMQHDPSYVRKGGKIRRVEKLQLTMRRILFVINERQHIKKQYRKQLEQEYIQKKRLELESAVSKAPEPLPEITHEMLRAKYYELRKGIDNINYLEKMFSKTEQIENRYKRADERVEKLDPEKEFSSFWSYQTEIGERPTQMEILKSHVNNWKSLNLKQRKIILGFLNARRSKDAKSQFRKELKILGQKIAFEEAKSRSEEMSAKN